MSRSSFFLLLSAGIALATNPDDTSFRDYIKRRKQSSGADWLTSTVASHLMSFVFKRKVYKFFSLIKVPETKVVYIGAFGNWVEVPYDLEL